MHVLFLATYPEDGASSRLRVTQFFPYLEAHGVRCTFRPLFDAEFYRAFYRRGRHLGEGAGLCRATLDRLLAAARDRLFVAVFLPRGAPIVGPDVVACK